MTDKRLEIKGAIFDMDGVLFNTEVLYEKFWTKAAHMLGYNMSLADVSAIRSTDSKVAREILCARVCPDFDYDGVRALRVRIMREYTDEHGVELMPGVVELLEFLKTRNIKIALATTSNMERARDYLGQGNILQYFDYLMTGDLVTNSKPNPEIYEKAAAGLALLPGECIAVEDSYNGVRAAYNAGCHAIMVPDRDMATPEMYEKCVAVLSQINQIIDLI